MSELARWRVVWRYHVSLRRPGSFVRAIAQPFWLQRRVRPELIVSPGSGPAVRIFLLARVFGIRQARLAHCI